MNTIGRIFRIAIFGESHGTQVGVLLDGVPVGIELNETDFMHDIQRRKSGNIGTSTRIEKDTPYIQSGIYKGKTTGAPILIFFKNENSKSDDYTQIKNIPRPGHADFTSKIKYKGHNDPRGGGHFSGRMTLALVAAGVLAKKIISTIHFSSKIISINGNENIEEAIATAITKQDTVGGIVECKVSNVPIGWGEPFFDSIESVISHLVFSIPSVKGIEFGSGFASATMWGSDHNDAIMDKFGKTKTNHAGGINGGISNGNELLFRVAIKPASSTPTIQSTYNFETKEVEQLQILGRHDLCIALRVPIVIEAAAAIALADFSLLSKSQL